MVLISDGSLFDTTSVQVAVLAVNDPPMPFNIISPDSGTLVSENQVTLCGSIHLILMAVS